MEDQNFTVATNTQLTYDGLRVGVASIKARPFVDAQGTAQHGPTVGLWIYHRDDSTQDRALYAYVGQEITVAEYRITVLEIHTEGRQRAAVLHIVKTASPA